MDTSDLELAIRSCNVKAVKCLIEDKDCDVNQNIGHKEDWNGKIIPERPLSFSLQNIKFKNDKWFKISRLLLKRKDIYVDAKCGLMDQYTVLGKLCNTQYESTFGVRMLLEHSRTDVSKGYYTPLYCA